MFKRTVAMLLALIISALLTACQPTPESSLIVNKTDGAINSLIEKPAQGPVIADGHITEALTLCGGRVVANVDADIKSKDDYYGVYEVERQAITQAQVDKATELLYGDRPIWNYTGQHTTKEKYDALINYLENFLKDMKSNRQKYEELVKDSNNIHNSVDDWMKSIQKQLDDFKHEQLDAPTEEELRKNVNKKLHYPTDDEDGIPLSKSTKMVMLSADMGRENQSLLMVNVPDNINSVSNSVYLKYNDGSESEDIHTINSMTNEQALKLAEQFALAMDKSFVLTSNKTNITETGGEYVFTFCIPAGGMPITRSREMSEYGRAWQTGDMRIIVDDMGIVSINWYEPIKVTKTINDKVDMISAEKAYETFIKYFELKYASDSLYSDLIEKKIFDIYEISVAYVIEPIQNNPNVARVMPCWEFICKQTIEMKEDITDSVSERMPLYAINALDGSIILSM